jgi:hypothetical protein
MGARELSDGARHVLTFYYVRLDAQVSSEAHVAITATAGLRRSTASVSISSNRAPA